MRTFLFSNFLLSRDIAIALAILRDKYLPSREVEFSDTRFATKSWFLSLPGNCTDIQPPANSCYNTRGRLYPHVHRLVTESNRWLRSVSIGETVWDGRPTFHWLGLIVLWP